MFIRNLGVFCLVCYVEFYLSYRETRKLLYMKVCKLVLNARSVSLSFAFQVFGARPRCEANAKSLLTKFHVEPILKSKINNWHHRLLASTSLHIKYQLLPWTTKDNDSQRSSIT
jgi:hypothetical protein